MDVRNSSSISFTSAYLRGEVAYGGWNLIGKGLGAVNVLLIISHLEVFKYGIYILVFAFYGILAGIFLKFLHAVIFNDIARYSAEGREPDAKRLYLETVGIRVLIAIILFLSVFFGAELIANWYDEDIALLFRTISFLFLIDVAYTSMRMLYQLRLKFSAVAARSTISNAIRLPLIIGLLATSTLTVHNLIVVYLIANFAGMLVFVPGFISLYKPWRAVARAQRWIIPLIIRAHGKWSGLTQALQQVTGNLQPWLIKLLINTEAVAIFSVAESMFAALKTFLPTETLTSLMPREIQNRERSSRILLRGTKYLFIFGFLLACAGALTVPVLVYLVVPHYLASVPLLLALLIALPLYSFRSMAGVFLVALRRQKYLFIAAAIRIGLTVVLTLTFLYFFGIWGMVLERIALTIIVGGLFFGYLLRYELAPGAYRVLYTFDDEDRAYLGAILRKIGVKFKQRFT